MLFASLRRIAYKNRYVNHPLLLEINTITKFFLFRMKYVIDGDCLFHD